VRSASAKAAVHLEKGEVMRTSRKKLAAIAGGLAVLAFAGAAFAYFTNSGSGDGTADVGTSSEIELSSPLVGDLYPDGDDVPVTVTIHNPGSGTQYVGTVSGVVETDDGGTPSDASDDCLGSWFEVDDIDYDGELAAGASDTADTNVRMLNVHSSQDACQDLTLDITWSSN
jgi:hypothetical protein